MMYAFCDINLAINDKAVVKPRRMYTEDDAKSMGGSHLVSGKDSSSLCLERPNVMRLLSVALLQKNRRC